MSFGKRHNSFSLGNGASPRFNKLSLTGIKSPKGKVKITTELLNQSPINVSSGVKRLNSIQLNLTELRDFRQESIPTPTDKPKKKVK
jgi:hypothetical protein